MPSRVTDLERLLRGVSFILQETARLSVPELRVCTTNASRHARELVQLATILPSAVIDARKASVGSPGVPAVSWRLRKDAPSTSFDNEGGAMVESSSIHGEEDASGATGVAAEEALSTETATHDATPLTSPHPSPLSESLPTQLELEPSAAALSPPVPPKLSAAFLAVPSSPLTPAELGVASVLQAVPSSPAEPRLDPGVAAARQPPQLRRQFRELAVPASPLARLWGFGGMAASLAVGAAGNALSGSSSAGSLAYSTAQAERLAEGLCRMRGAALKIGQMLSLLDEGLLPPAITAALERVRTQADVMPPKQLEAAMRAELGPDWRSRLGGAGFEPAPVAAASIGQVHRATLPDGRRVAVKVQYPGVADSIHSDIGNLRRLLQFANVLPKGLYIENIMQVARNELTDECNYEREAACQERFRSLTADQSDVVIPAVVRELSTRRVLVTEWLEGVPIDQAVHAGLDQEARDRIARTLLRLTLRELFEWRFMQTDPNWGNFFYDSKSARVGLLDFGASRDYPKPFVDNYMRLVWAAANNDRKTIEDVSVRIGFLTGLESPVMRDAHVASGLVVGEPFLAPGVFDFQASGITTRLSQYVSVFSEHRLTPPPDEVYSLHRKLAGAFLICIRMGARIHCRDLLEEAWRNYRWGPE